MFNNRDLQAITEALDGQTVALNAIKDAIVLQQKPTYSDDLGARVADLEVKMSKLWNLLTAQTPNGEDKLSKFGKRFGGKSKGFV